MTLQWPQRKGFAPNTAQHSSQWRVVIVPDQLDLEIKKGRERGKKLCRSGFDRLRGAPIPLRVGATTPHEHVITASYVWFRRRGQESSLVSGRPLRRK